MTKYAQISNWIQDYENVYKSMSKYFDKGKIMKKYAKSSQYMQE